MWQQGVGEWSIEVTGDNKKHAQASIEPKVSVVMSVFNGEYYLAEAIGSILNQTFADFEFIIINDGSTDGSLDIIDEYAERDDRIIVISRENKGLSASLNEAIAVARGFWIVRMDADDIALPNRIETQLMWMEASGADLCGGNIEVIGKSFRRKIRYFPKQNQIYTHLLFNSAFAHPTVVVRSSVIKRFPYAVEYGVAEDYELWTRLAANGVRMTNCPDVVLKYRRHSGQVTVKNMEKQEELRNLISRRYMENSGIHWVFGNIFKFHKIGDVDRLIKEIDDFKRAIEWFDSDVFSVGVWKMAIRSGCLGLGLWRKLAFSNVVKLSKLRSITLFFACLVKLDDKQCAFKYLYARR